MSLQSINTGTGPNTGTGDPARIAFQKIAANFTYHQNLIDGLTSGYQDELAIADTPTADGFYLASESGTYTNAGGLVVDLNAGITFINKKGANYSKVVVPIDVVPDGEVAEGDANAVSGDKVFTYVNARNKVEAEHLVKKYSSVLVFSGFADTSTATPSHTSYKAYIAIENGTIFGVSVKKGQIIIDDGTDFIPVHIDDKTIFPFEQKSYNKLDPNRTIPDHYLHNTTGLPVKLAGGTRFISEFIYVKGVTFVNSQIYGTGTLWAYDKYKNPISRPALNGDGINGKYILPANTEYIRLSGRNPDSNWLYIDELVQTFHAYGVTKESLEIDALEIEVDTKARIDYVKNIDLLNTMNIADSRDYIQGFSINVLGNPVVSASKSITPFIYIGGKSFLNTNFYFWGGVYFYAEDYSFISSGTRVDDKYAIPSNAFYFRGVVNTSSIGQEYLYVDRVLNKHFPFGTDTFNYKWKGKKLVTIGDSITYQKRWQERLCDLTGMIWDEDETRLGVGNVEIDGTTYEDLGNFVRSDAGITDTGNTFVNSYGATVSIYTDGSKFYRKAMRMAEGGETVMPMAQQSIYSRCGDSKYYEPDVIIVHAGANDRGYCNWLPTILPNQELTDITGLANFESDDPNSTTNYEIYTTEARLNDIGDYVAEGDTQGTRKYDSNFRACYRGMMKKIVDANPEAIIICIQPHQTILYTDTTPNRVNEFVTDELNRVIADVADEFGCQLINMKKLFGWYNASQWFTSDGVWIHPNTAGGLKMADYIASNLE